MQIRLARYQDYKMSEAEAREILEICRAPAFAYRELVVSAAIKSNPYIADSLVKSICDRRSWTKQMDICISENSFYGYRRKALAILKPQFEALGLIKSVQENG